MEILSTPRARFENLPLFPYAPHYVDVADPGRPPLRLAYVDEGPRDGEVLLLLHGEPTWSFLYRKMIPPFLAAGYRVVAPDLIGFGRSDKPTRIDDYSYERHLLWLSRFMEKTGLEKVSLVCQDWGGMLGLRLVAQNPDGFARLVVANTGLPTGKHPLPEAFFQWRKFARAVPVFSPGKIVGKGVVIPLDEPTMAAYEAPFPDESFKAGPRAFPLLVPVEADDPQAMANARAWEVLARFDKPVLTAFSDGDLIFKNGDRPFQKYIPGSRDQPHVTIKNGGHFLQEDQGEAFAEAVLVFLGQNPLSP